VVDVSISGVDSESFTKTLMASFGFDVDFVLRRLASSQDYNRVILLAIQTDGFERVKKAYSTLSLVCTSLKRECILEPIKPREDIIRSVFSILSREVEKSYVDVYLTGGPRILVIALLLSTFMLPQELASKVKVIAEGEGFDCYMEFNVALIQEVLKLDSRDKSILQMLMMYGPLTLSELAERTNLPKSTTYRRLEELMDKKLVEKTESETYRVRNHIQVSCK
jgi:CRISPR-associated protein Csa3